MEEEARLSSSSNILNLAGFDPMLYEDFADATFDLMRAVSGAMSSGDAEDVLMQAFNDEETQNYVMTYLKVRSVVLIDLVSD